MLLVMWLCMCTKLYRKGLFASYHTLENVWHSMNARICTINHQPPKNVCIFAKASHIPEEGTHRFGYSILHHETEIKQTGQRTSSCVTIRDENVALLTDNDHQPQLSNKQILKQEREFKKYSTLVLECMTMKCPSCCMHTDVSVTLWCQKY